MTRVHVLWGVLCLAAKKYEKMDGFQCAAAFAHYAFFALFPLSVLSVSVASAFIDRNRAAAEVVDYLETFVPISGGMQSFIVGTISGVVKARGQAGVIAFLMLVWAAGGFFTTLIRAVNCAWGADEYSWWRLSLKGLAFLAIMLGALILGIGGRALAGLVTARLGPGLDFGAWVHGLGSFSTILAVTFLSLVLLYGLAPRRRTRFTQVWVAALGATVLLQAAEGLFSSYLQNFAKFNAVYGTIGGIMALLLWIYISGCIFIFGACVCAAQDGLGKK